MHDLRVVGSWYRIKGGMNIERLSDRAIEIINELHTERLDYNSEYLPLIDAANKLGLYEDLGLEPSEVSVLCDMDRRAKMAEMLRTEEKYSLSIDRIKELVEADRDGRCVFTKCKIGDTVFVVGKKKIVKARVQEIYLDDIPELIYLVDFECDNCCDGCPFNSWSQSWEGEWQCDGGYGDGSIKDSNFGKTVFRTREAAEAALKAMKEGKNDG